jgi:prepilin-type N-terminal cleavage/methylation domain-containing protein
MNATTNNTTTPRARRASAPGSEPLSFSKAPGWLSGGNSLCHNRKLARAFTLIEILTVLAIMLILMGLVLGGIKIWGGGSALKTTQARFEALNSMLSNMTASSPNTFNPSFVPNSSPPIPWLSTQCVLWPNLNQPPLVARNQYLLNGVVVTSDANATFNPSSGYTYFNDITTVYSPTNNNFYATDFNSVGDNSPSQTLNAMNQPVNTTGRNEAIILTDQLIMNQLSLLPDNVTILGQLPPAAKVYPTGMTAPTATSPVPLQAPVLLDGWNDPIIFVPAGGLWGVEAGQYQADTYNPATQYSLGQQVVFQNIYYTWINTTPGNSKPPLAGAAPPAGSNWGGVCSPDLKPFWASAGPDGNFIYGYDNVYSFQQ